MAKSKYSMKTSGRKVSKKIYDTDYITLTTHVKYSNFFVTITDSNGNMIAKGSAGATSTGKSGGRAKKTPFANVSAIGACLDTAQQRIKTENIHIIMKGNIGNNRNTLLTGQILPRILRDYKIKSLVDYYGIAHGGTRKRKGRKG